MSLDALLEITDTAFDQVKDYARGKFAGEFYASFVEDFNESIPVFTGVARYVLTGDIYCDGERVDPVKFTVTPRHLSNDRSIENGPAGEAHVSADGTVEIETYDFISHRDPGYWHALDEGEWLFQEGATDFVKEYENRILDSTDKFKNVVKTAIRGMW